MSTDDSITKTQAIVDQMWMDAERMLPKIETVFRRGSISIAEYERLVNFMSNLVLSEIGMRKVARREQEQ